MDTPNRATTMKHVTETFAAWKVVHDRIAQLETAYTLALQQHSEAAAPVPLALEAEIAVLRVESDRLLLTAQQALLKIKTPRASHEGTDSTWS